MSTTDTSTSTPPPAVEGEAGGGTEVAAPAPAPAPAPAAAIGIGAGAFSFGLPPDHAVGFTSDSPVPTTAAADAAAPGPAAAAAADAAAEEEEEEEEEEAAAVELVKVPREKKTYFVSRACEDRRKKGSLDQQYKDHVAKMTADGLPYFTFNQYKMLADTGPTSSEAVALKRIRDGRHPRQAFFGYEEGSKPAGPRRDEPGEAEAVFNQYIRDLDVAEESRRHRQQ
jgi:hypothetical protein